MKKWMIGISLLLSSVCFAQQKPMADVIATRINSVVYAQSKEKPSKPYYPNQAIAQVCESWRSCSVWAFNQYTKDPSFKIIRAELKTQRKVYRHRIAQETSLFVEATYKNRPLYVEFTTPHIIGRGQSYNYISKFPQ